MTPLSSPKGVPKNKRTSIRKSALNVSGERLLAEDNHLEKVSANIKKEVEEKVKEKTPMFAFSEEFVKFMKNPEPEKKSKQGNMQTGPRKLNIKPSATQSEKKLTKGKEQKPNKTLKELKTDIKRFKPVDITDKKGNLVSTAKKPQLAKKDSPKFKLKTNADIERDAKKITMTKKVLERNSTLQGNESKEKPGKKFRNKSSVADMYKSSRAKKNTIARKHVESKATVQGNEAKESPASQAKKYKCGQCDLRFVGAVSLDKHRLIKHTTIKTEKADGSDTGAEKNEDDVAIEYEETEETQCPYCYKQFSEFKRLSAHMKIHKDD